MIEFKELQRLININEAMRILTIKTGKYHEFCAAYVRKKVDGNFVYVSPERKNDFDYRMMPLLKSICGSCLGENPFDPNHPIQRWENYKRI